MENLFVPLFVELGPEVLFGGVCLQVNILDKLTMSVVYRSRSRLNETWFPVLSSRSINLSLCAVGSNHVLLYLAGVRKDIVDGPVVDLGTRTFCGWYTGFLLELLPIGLFINLPHY
jgi:hypothetical protein